MQARLLAEIDRLHAEFEAFFDGIETHDGHLTAFALANVCAYRAVIFAIIAGAERNEVKAWLHRLADAVPAEDQQMVFPILGFDVAH